MLSALCASSSQLELPPDFERGWVADSLVLPENILAFLRQSTSQLHLQPPVQHHRFVLIVALKGSGDIRIDKQIHHLRPGEALLLFPFQIHDYLFFPLPDINWLFLTFSTKTPLELEPLRNSIYQLTSGIVSLLHHFLAHATPVPPPPASTLKAQLYLALVIKEFLLGESLSLDSKISNSSAAVKLLEKVNKFIHSNIQTPFEISDLARQIGYSESHLRSLFRQAVRISLGSYITTVRLRKATGLLHAGESGVSEVAEACGYRSIFAFSRAFKRTFGCSPAGFRKKHQTAFSEHSSKRK